MKEWRIFSCDFETTVYDEQERTDVWAAACVELYKEDVSIFHSIDEQFAYFRSLNCNVIAYYHNLKFDGSFWLDYLIQELHYKQAYIVHKEEPFVCSWVSDKEMVNKEFKYSISDRGQWYTIKIKVDGHTIEIRDSLKLLPFSVKRIGQSFGTKHKKLDMEYVGFRFPGCNITDEEKSYIANDVLVVKEALEIMFNEGHNKLTIGSCCLDEFRKTHDKIDYKWMFPKLQEIEIDKAQYGQPNADKYIRRSYKGGWCYVVKGKQGKILGKGFTADVNSLYPSMMHSQSGNRYPIGKPVFWVGDIPPQAIGGNKYYFLRIRTRFYLKQGKLPFIQIKNTFSYLGNESLETSDILVEGKYYSHRKNETGELVPNTVELTLTMTDWELIQEHYTLKDLEILDGCWFYSEIGIFDDYINKYKKQKMESKGAKRESAKLFLNNLYGKLAAGDDSSFKVAYIKDSVVKFLTVEEHEKRPGFIACGSAITSYARSFTIRHAQSNYYGPNKEGFCYADTDSIHCDMPIDNVKMINVHHSDFCCWKLESYWDTAFFTRQKTYIEHITHEDGEIVEPYYNIKCAGMPDKCKNTFINDLENGDKTLNDFTVGLRIDGKLTSKRISGGTILKETTYEMR